MNLWMKLLFNIQTLIWDFYEEKFQNKLIFQFFT